MSPLGGFNLQRQPHRVFHRHARALRKVLQHWMRRVAQQDHAPRRAKSQPGHGRKGTQSFQSDPCAMICCALGWICSKPRLTSSWVTGFPATASGASLW